MEMFKRAMFGVDNVLSYFVLGLLLVLFGGVFLVLGIGQERDIVLRPAEVYTSSSAVLTLVNTQIEGERGGEVLLKIAKGDVSSKGSVEKILKEIPLVTNADGVYLSLKVFPAGKTEFASEFFIGEEFPVVVKEAVLLPFEDASEGSVLVTLYFVRKEREIVGGLVPHE